MMVWLISVVLGLAAGVASVLFGIGGGIIVVPALSLLGTRPLYAVGTSTLMIFLTSLAGSVQHWRQAEVKIRSTLPLAIPSVLTAQLGVELARQINEQKLAIAFVLFIFFSLGLLRLKQWSFRPPTSEDSTRAPHYGRLVMIGAVAGLCSGLFGVGGGIILVPFLLLLGQKPAGEAVRISLFVVFFTSVSALLGHMWHGHVMFTQGIVLGAAGIVGSRYGVQLLGRLSDRRIELIFAAGLAVAGLLMVLKVFQVVP